MSAGFRRPDRLSRPSLQSSWPGAASSALRPRPAPTASPTTPPDPATVYATIEEQVRAIRGLEEKVPVEPKILDEAALTDYVKEQFRKDNPEELVKANERMLKVLGLLPADASLEDLYIEPSGRPGRGPLQPRGTRRSTSYRGQAASARPRRRRSPTSTPTPSRTRTSAWQASNSTRPGKGDRAIARLALVEGDATPAHDALADRQPDPGGAHPAVGRVARSRGHRGPSRRCRPSSANRCCSPYTGGLTFTQRLQSQRWLGRGRRRIRQATRLHRADPASREVRQRRGTDGRRPPRRPRRPDGRRLVRRPRGHLGGVSAEALAGERCRRSRHGSS